MRNIKTEAGKIRDKQEKNKIEYNECKNDVGDLFEKLNSWKEESQSEFSTFMFNTYAEFSNIISPKRAIIEKGIESLVEELSAVKAQLSIRTQERNDLYETVENLSCQNKKLCDKLEENLRDNMQDIGGSAVNNPETTEQDSEEPSMSSNDNDPEDNCGEIGEISNEIVQQSNDIPSSFQNNWKVNGTLYPSPNEEVPKEVESYHKQEEREDMPANFEGMDEKEPIDVREELVQFEDTKGDLHTLIRSVDNKGQRKHACENCPYTSTSRSHLKEHVENVHEKIRKHFCKECNYASYRKRGLNHHIKVVHDKSMHVCEDCGYAIERKALLNSHRASAHGISFNQF